MPRAWDEISLIRRLNTTVTTLVSKKATPSAVVESLQDHRFAHFSCHGILETGKPFAASFKLYQGERLTLLDIIRSRLPSAEFAFLSACHTAELTEECIADEASMRDYTFLSRYNILVSGVWLGRCGQWPTLTDRSSRSIFMHPFFQTNGKLCHIIRERQRPFRTPYRYRGERKR